MEIPECILYKNLKDFEFGTNNLSFFTKEDLAKEQIGFRFDNEQNEKKDWFGKEFLVIGKEINNKNPIIAKTNEPNIPIYMMFDNDKTTIEKVANSYEEYAKVLKMIENTDLYRKDKISCLINSIEEYVPSNSMYYWNDLINSAYNYLVD